MRCSVQGNEHNTSVKDLQVLIEKASRCMRATASLTTTSFGLRIQWIIRRMHDLTGVIVWKSLNKKMVWTDRVTYSLGHAYIVRFRLTLFFRAGQTWFIRRREDHENTYAEPSDSVRRVH